MASLGANFTQLMQQAAKSLPTDTINESMVGEVAGQLDSLQGLQALGQYVDPITGHIRSLKAGSMLLNDQGIRVEGDDVFAVFTGDQTYVGTTVSDGDLIIGNSSADQANIYWDKSAGTLSFRGGTTVQGQINTSGEAIFGGGDISFDDTGMSLSISTAGGGTDVIRWYHPADGNADVEIYGAEYDTDEYDLGLKCGFDNGTYAPISARSYMSAIALHSSAALGYKWVSFQVQSLNTSGSHTRSEESLFNCRVYMSSWNEYLTIYQTQTIFNNSKNDVDFAVYDSTKVALGVDAGQNIPVVAPLSGASAPSTVAQGQLWHDTNTTSIKYYLGGGWRILSSW